jgi:hypothetical protein
VRGAKRRRVRESHERDRRILQNQRNEVLDGTDPLYSVSVKNSCIFKC